MTQAPHSAEKKHAALSRELSEFLIEFSISVHRYAMYPAGHPSLAPGIENVIGRLAEIFEKRRTVSIGVANRQLIIEGVATDPRHPVLSDLARRLHDHQLGAISFSFGMNAREMEGMLRILARETEREGTPIGLRPDLLPTWEHARLYPVGYDQLEMKSDLGVDETRQMDRATQLWLGLAQSALARDQPIDPNAAPDAKELAAAIDWHSREAAYDQVIVGYLLQLADELKEDRRGGETEKVRRRVSALVNELGEGTLARLIDMGGNETQRRRFLLDANQGLAVDAVVKVMRAAAEGGGQTISSSMTRLLSKLAVHADLGNEVIRARADTALRENVEQLIADWKLADPNPDQYTAMLDAMAKSTPLFQIRLEREGQRISGPERVVQLALEVDAWGPTVQTAVSDLIGLGLASTLVRLIDEAPPGTRVAEELRKHLTAPAHLKKILSGEIDEAALQALIDGMGGEAIPALLDVLAESDDRSVRRKVFDRLARMGPEVGVRAVERLADGRWFVLRNMLALLQRLETLPPHFDPAKLLEHSDERVRREAIPLALRRGVAGRERVVASALGDLDERTVRIALLELQKDLPETLVPVVVSRVVKAERSAEIRALGARVLGNSRSNLALEVLLGLSVEGRSLMGRAKLADKSLLVIAAIQTLGRSWPGDARAREVVSLAARSKDPDLRKAAETS